MVGNFINEAKPLQQDMFDWPIPQSIRP